MDRYILTETNAETKARQQMTCPCCKKEKDLGLIVCWTCFGHDTPTGFIPFKESGMEFEDWLEKAKI